MFAQHQLQIKQIYQLKINIYSIFILKLQDKQVDSAEGENLANQYDIPFFEVSAKLDKGI